jgi:hypothetical protein
MNRLAKERLGSYGKFYSEEEKAGFKIPAG